VVLGVLAGREDLDDLGALVGKTADAFPIDIAGHGHLLTFWRVSCVPRRVVRPRRDRVWTRRAPVRAGHVPPVGWLGTMIHIAR
jgi:hypothetical protein